MYIINSLKDFHTCRNFVLFTCYFYVSELFQSLSVLKCFLFAFIILKYLGGFVICQIGGKIEIDSCNPPVQESEDFIHPCKGI